MRRSRARRATTLVLAPLLAITAGCTARPPDRPAATPPAIAATEAPADGCPVLAPEPDGPTAAGAAIDYVDFVNHDGRHYLAGFDDVPPVTRTDLGEVVLRSACSFSAVNERTGRDPARPRDGDTGFLPPGTAIRAVRGWSPECRLAVDDGAQIRVYLAQDPDGDRARPVACALDRTTPPAN